MASFFTKISTKSTCNKRKLDLKKLSTKMKFKKMVAQASLDISTSSSSESEEELLTKSKESIALNPLRLGSETTMPIHVLSTA